MKWFRPCLRAIAIATLGTLLISCATQAHGGQGCRTCLPCLQDSGAEPSGSAADEADKQDAESLKIVIADEPRTIDPASIVPEPLARKLTVRFEETSIRDVVAWIRDEAGVSVLLDEADLADANILLSEPVTDRLDDQPLYLLLDRLESISLGWYMEGGILHITTLEKAEENLSTVSLNVGAFLDQGFEAAALKEAIVLGTNIEKWEDSGGPGSLVMLGDVLFVRQSDAMHRRVQGLLKGLEQHGRRTWIDDPREHEELRDKLDSEVSVDFEDTPLVEAIEDLAKQVGADIRLDEASFREARIRSREPVSLKLSNQKLSAVLQSLIASLRLTWTLQDGTILITTQPAAETQLKTAVFDVRDLSRTSKESQALAETIMMQSAGQWMETDGGPGTIQFARPGVMVVRNSEKALQDILRLLEAYRQALKVSKVRDRNQLDPREPLTEYYRLPTVIANDLEKWLMKLVEPPTWKTPDQPDQLGTIVNLKSTPALIGPENKILRKSVDQKSGIEDGLLMDYSVLIIHQTRATHERIRDLIFKIENGSLEALDQGGMGGLGGMGGMGGGGFGGGYFSVPDGLRN